MVDFIMYDYIVYNDPFFILYILSLTNHIHDSSTVLIVHELDLYFWFFISIISNFSILSPKLWVGIYKIFFILIEWVYENWSLSEAMFLYLYSNSLRFW